MRLGEFSPCVRVAGEAAMRHGRLPKPRIRVLVPLSAALAQQDERDPEEQQREELEGRHVAQPPESNQSRRTRRRRFIRRTRETRQEENR